MWDQRPPFCMRWGVNCVSDPVEEGVSEWCDLIRQSKAPHAKADYRCGSALDLI